MTIHPTRTCFDDAVAFCEQRARALIARPPSECRRELLRLRIAHGTIAVPDEQPPGFGVQPGQRIAHAWVEEDGRTVWQTGFLDGERVTFSMPWPDFARLSRPESVTHYTLFQVLRHHDRSQSTGPWRDDLKALCR